LLNQFLSSLLDSVKASFGYTVKAWSAAPLVVENRLQTRAQPSFVADQPIESFVSAVRFIQNVLCKFCLDFQDMCRVHD
jgi:hypothetical protein